MSSLPPSSVTVRWDLGHGLYPVACDHRHFERYSEFLRPPRKPGGPFKLGDRADGLLASAWPWIAAIRPSARSIWSAATTLVRGLPVSNPSPFAD